MMSSAKSAAVLAFLVCAAWTVTEGAHEAVAGVRATTRAGLCAMVGRQTGNTLSLPAAYRRCNPISCASPARCRIVSVSGPGGSTRISCQCSSGPTGCVGYWVLQGGTASLTCIGGAPCINPCIKQFAEDLTTPGSQLVWCACP